MKIIKFQGGLGNQLFQYAFLRNLESIHHCDSVKGDFSYYKHPATVRDTYLNEDEKRIANINQLNIYDVAATQDEINKVYLFNYRKNVRDPLKFSSKVYSRVKLFIERTLNNKYYSPFDLSHVEIKHILHYGYFDGYWQSWKYVDEIEKELRKEICIKDKYSTKTQQIINQLSKEMAVLIGVRRGDYQETEANRKIFGSFSSDYYNKAIHYIKKRVENPIFYVFSDDISWVKENINFKSPVNYREEEDQTNDVEELFIMGACKHAIIVNSTFQWWGAWLIDNNDKIVIAPEPWFNDGRSIDSVPPEWHQMKRC